MSSHVLVSLNSLFLSFKIRIQFSHTGREGCFVNIPCHAAQIDFLS